MSLQHHFTDTDNNSILNHHSRTTGKDHWLNSAILRQHDNFLNLQTNTNSEPDHNNHNNNNQWLARSMMQRNVSDVRENDIASNDSIIASAAAAVMDSPDLHNQSRNLVAGQVFVFLV